MHVPLLVGRCTRGSELQTEMSFSQNGEETEPASRCGGGILT